MKKYSASEARQNFSQLLDDVERGHPIIIERRGKFFRVGVERRPTVKKKRVPIFAETSLLVEQGMWTWQSGSSGLRLVRKPAKKKRHGR
jgi:antitoxin (DNA-binding transcriptional repressor) of toxin-antitoxin stability system